MRVEEEIDQQTLDRRRIMGDLAVALRADRRMLEPVERVCRRAVLIRPPRLGLPASTAITGSWRTWSWSITSS
jgi:hypothetical protein